MNMTVGEEGSWHGRPSTLHVWLFGVAATFLVSICAVVGAFLLPLMKKRYFNLVLNGLIGLAVGCLSGSAVFHLIPQSFAYDLDHDGEVLLLHKGLVIMGGVYLFFVSERLMKIAMESRKRSKGAATTTTTASSATIIEHGCASHNGDASQLCDSSSVPSAVQQGPQSSYMSLKRFAEEGAVKTHEHEHEIEREDAKSHPIKTVAWMVIAGDGLHNFIDGLGMGAAFTTSIANGVSVSVAVMFEELPHELGDLAILINSGMSLRQALFYNFLSALTCLAGLCIGILAGEIGGSWIFGLAGGAFLYISLVDMLPEMTRDAELQSKKSVRDGLIMLGTQNIGFLSGVALMYLLLRFSTTLLGG